MGLVLEGEETIQLGCGATNPDLCSVLSPKVPVATGVPRSGQSAGLPRTPGVPALRQG